MAVLPSFIARKCQVLLRDIILNGEKPRMIDEWQEFPEIWDAVRTDVNSHHLAGQFILTGSSTPRRERPRHSGAGRIATITMRPMSLYESSDSSGEVSLRMLFDEEYDVSGSSDFLKYYRDKNGLECDAIVHTVDGKWGAIEIKLGDGVDVINEAAKTLLKFESVINTEKMQKPSFLMVLSGTAQLAYRRKNGVYVVPIGCLKP